MKAPLSQCVPGVSQPCPRGGWDTFPGNLGELRLNSQVSQVSQGFFYFLREIREAGEAFTTLLPSAKFLLNNGENAGTLGTPRNYGLIPGNSGEYCPKGGWDRAGTGLGQGSKLKGRRPPFPSKVISPVFKLLLTKGGTGKWKTRNSTFFRLFFFANAHLCASRRYQCGIFRMLIFVH